MILWVQLIPQRVVGFGVLPKLLHGGSKPGSTRLGVSGSP